MNTDTKPAYALGPYISVGAAVRRAAVAGSTNQPLIACVYAPGGIDESIATAAHISACLNGSDPRTRALVKALEAARLVLSDHENDPSACRALDVVDAALALAKGMP